MRIVFVLKRFTSKAGDGVVEERERGEGGRGHWKGRVSVAGPLP